MKLFRSQTMVILALVALGAVEGCGSQSANDKIPKENVKVRGRILKNGLPIQMNTAGLPPGDPGMQVVFIKLGTAGAGTEIPANVISATEGTFELPGGIAPGRYRVTVSLAPVGSGDMFNGKYDKQNSKIEVEIKADEELVIDLDKSGK